MREGRKDREGKKYNVCLSKSTSSVLGVIGTGGTINCTFRCKLNRTGRRKTDQYGVLKL